MKQVLVKRDQPADHCCTILCTKSASVQDPRARVDPVIDEKGNAAELPLGATPTAAWTILERMPVEIIGTPVEITVVAIDVVENAPVTERTASRVRFEGTAHPERTRPRDKRKKKQTKEQANFEENATCSLMCGMLWVGIMHLFNLVYYYEGEPSKAYCEETGLATWVLGIAWLAGGGFPHQFLSMVSWCLIAACTARLDNWWVRFILSQILIVLLQICWFCSGQSARLPTHPHTHHPPTHHTSMVRRSAPDPPLALTHAAGMFLATNGCDNITYANITSGGWPGCSTASDGYVACGLEPRPGCCDDRLYRSAEFFVGWYYVCIHVWGFILLTALICLICSQRKKVSRAFGGASKALRVRVQSSLAGERSSGLPPSPSRPPPPPPLPPPPPKCSTGIGQTPTEAAWWYGDGCED